MEAGDGARRPIAMQAGVCMLCTPKGALLAVRWQGAKHARVGVADASHAPRQKVESCARAQLGRLVQSGGHFCEAAAAPIPARPVRDCSLIGCLSRRSKATAATRKHPHAAGGGTCGQAVGRAGECAQPRSRTASLRARRGARVRSPDPREVTLSQAKRRAGCPCTRPPLPSSRPTRPGLPSSPETTSAKEAG